MEEKIKMNELTMENTYMKHPYKGSELGFIFEKEKDAVGFKGEKLVKGKLYIVDPDKKLKSLLENVSPNRDERNWTVMGDLVCIQEDKLNDPYHIVHTFIQLMKPIEYEYENKDGEVVKVINKLY